MHPRTKATLDHLRSVEWFTHVGEPASDAVAVVSSWEEAIASCRSQMWEDLCAEAQRQYVAKLTERSKTFSVELWNEAAKALKPGVEALVASKSSDVIDQFNLPQVFTDCVRSDILLLCMEAEFADIYPPGFYSSQGYWYVRGRFPCGWQGAFPRGRLVIF